jgi:hypothetical protein
MRARWLFHSLVQKCMVSIMSTSNFTLMPQNLNDDQRNDWLRRQRNAENTLAIQALGGTTPNAETISHFQRYVSGEITLAQAIAQVREQMAQEHAAFRQYLNRSSSAT